MSAPHVPLSILDLVPVSNGASMREAIDVAMDCARHADDQGYARIWYAEHHNTESIAASATTLLMNQALNSTRRIRVGSGGIMLPNHAPLHVIEQFGTLVQLHGDRVDLGLGRAPGTDGHTAQLLGRSSAEPTDFARSIADMQAWASSNTTSRSRIGAYIAQGTHIPMWVLGSSLAGASIAATLGLPFSVASHFAPAQYLQALELYRREFNPDAPTAQIDEPRTMVAVNALVAQTDAHARRLFTTTQQVFASLASGHRLGIQPPVDDITSVVAPHLLERAHAMLAVQAVGSPHTVRDALEAIQRHSGADELIVTSYVHDPHDRHTSQRLLAEAWLH